MLFSYRVLTLMPLFVKLYSDGKKKNQSSHNYFNLMVLL